MTKIKSTKRALLSSLLALIVCVTMLIGSTFAWFTDSVTSAGNKIVAGTLEVDLLMADADGNYASIADKDAAIFGANSLVAQNNAADTLWEPGKTQIVYLGVENKGNLDLKYNILLNVIDGGLIGSLEYAIVDGANAKTAPITATKWADIKAQAQTGDIIAGNIVAAPNGAIKANEDIEYFALAVHMKEEAGNEYQDKNITIDVTVVATQLNSENDSFGSDYDKDADYSISVSSEADLIAALATGEKIELGADITITEAIVLPTDGNAVINGNGFSLVREASNTGHLLSIGENAALTLNNVILDGGNIESTGNLVYVDSNSTLTLNDGAVIQNHRGSDSAIHTDGSTTIVMNDGSVIQNNYSTAAAPAITGGLQTTFEFNGGKITGNKTATGGASAIWSGNWAVMTISGDFELTNNYSEAGSSAIRFASQSHFRMNDGTISGNTNAENKGGAIYGWNTSMELFGGTITDNGANAIDFDGGRGMTIGETNTIDTIVFGMSTNHDRVYLAENFGTIHFDFDGTDTPASNLNFVPAEGYVYTEGDEDRLICEHEGYSTYWDVESNTFKLQAAY